MHVPYFHRVVAPKTAGQALTVRAEGQCVDRDEGGRSVAFAVQCSDFLAGLQIPNSQRLIG